MPLSSHNQYKLVRPEQIQQNVQTALKEDIGDGDVTATLIDANTQASAQVICREHAILCGQQWFEEVFRQVDERVTLIWQVQDGDEIQPDQCICQLQGPARALLTGERSALNFLQSLSATATKTQQYVRQVAGTHCQILDTRKTLPGLRDAQKYAVQCGGGTNHRSGLFDAVLIKENHILAAGSIKAAMNTAQRLYPDLSIIVEVETHQELQQALDAGAIRLLLDNMSIPQLEQAIHLNNGRAKLEASGGITLENIPNIASTGVDFISVGSLTKDIRAVDFSMRIVTLA